MEDLIKIGLVEYIHTRVLTGTPPTDYDLLGEAREIVKKAEEFVSLPGTCEVSWFRDLIIYSHNGAPSPSSSGEKDIPWTQKLKDIKKSAPYNNLETSTIPCSKERQLKTFVMGKQALGLTATDFELQVEACRILDEVELVSNFKCKSALAWFKYLVTASKEWLVDFRKRAHLPRSDEMALEHIRSSDPTSIDYSIHNEQRLENEMIDWVKLQRAQGITPTDADIQHHARMIVYKNDDTWNQTAMDNMPILYLFKRQQGLAPDNDDGPIMPPLPESTLLNHSSPNPAPSPKLLHWDLEDSEAYRHTFYRENEQEPQQHFYGNNCPPNGCSGGPIEPLDRPLHTLVQNQPSTNTNPAQPLRYFLNDANCYGRLVRELSRFVTTCTSVNNPNRHVSFSFPHSIAIH